MVPSVQQGTIGKEDVNSEFIVIRRSVARGSLSVCLDAAEHFQDGSTQVRSERAIVRNLILFQKQPLSIDEVWVDNGWERQKGSWDALE